MAEAVLPEVRAAQRRVVATVRACGVRQAYWSAPSVDGFKALWTP
ncbi:hypothetical protein ACFXKW_31995 [Streptomyces sp. NPDC059193]